MEGLICSGRPAGSKRPHARRIQPRGLLSYASQDAEAARRICEALRAAGVEVWFDQSELVGGDAWDAKIRKQIKECALFVPIISASTQARTEGYFRLEWRLADQRTHLMAKGRAFLLPVVIDDTRDADAHVPDSFLDVQWTRLAGGETSAAFCARVRALLEGGVPPAGREAEIGHAAPSAGTAARHFSPAWLFLLIPLAILLLAGGGMIIKRFKDAARPPGRTGSAPRSEAQQLVAKARVILDEGDDMNRETYALAEELLVKAEALDPGEASAWALHAQLSEFLFAYSFDRSSARREALRAQADRAFKLAPGSVDAQLARAYAQRAFDQLEPALIGLRELAARAPDDWRVHRLLGRICVFAGKTEEARAALNRALQLSPDDPRIKSDYQNVFMSIGRFAEAQDNVRRGLQGRSSARLLASDAYLKLIWSGELDAAAAAIREWPAWFLLEDRGAGHAAFVALWRRDATGALEILQRFPRDYFRDLIFTGPRAVLSAWAHEQAGHAESARADWQLARQVAERELNKSPDDPEALHWKAWAMARLGETAEAGSILRRFEERNANVRGSHVYGGFCGLALALGQVDNAIHQIGRIRPNPSTGIRAITKTVLRLNPVFDPLRADPRFQALIDAAPGPGN